MRTHSGALVGKLPRAIDAGHARSSPCANNESISAYLRVHHHWERDHRVGARELVARARRRRATDRRWFEQCLAREDRPLASVKLHATKEAS